MTRPQAARLRTASQRAGLDVLGSADRIVSVSRLAPGTQFSTINKVIFLVPTGFLVSATSGSTTSANSTK
jgi:hypothetical protein